MKLFILTIFYLFNISAFASAFYELKANDINGTPVNFKKFKGKVLLITNTASKCGFTYQYEQLQKVYERFKNKGFLVLGFPSNDFGNQEPGSNKEIKKFCKLRKVSFPLFEKNNVSGSKIQPVFQYLVKNSKVNPNSEVQWNFEKFLVDRNGVIVSRFESGIEPNSIKIIQEIEKSINQQ